MALERITQSGRITSLFGTYLPPKRKQDASGHLTISFKLLGTIPSKKNLIWAASNLFFVLKGMGECKTVPEAITYLKNNLKVFIQNNKKYTEWVAIQTPVVQEQAKFWHEKFKNQGLRLPLDCVTVKVYHYWRDDMDRDLTNKLDSITDLLVSAGIVKNDNWRVIKRIHSEGESYKDQIIEAITRIDITQSFFD
jgi:hypothetical protein